MELVDLGFRHSHIGIECDLVALDDVLPPHLRRQGREPWGVPLEAGRRRWLVEPDGLLHRSPDALVLDPPAGHPVDLVESDITAPRGEVEADRDVDKAEADGPDPDRARHLPSFLHGVSRPCPV